MKTVPEIVILINTKINEHKKEIDGANEQLEILKKKDKPGPYAAMQQLILKDKIVFHKAAALALNDLKDSIK